MIGSIIIVIVLFILIGWVLFKTFSPSIDIITLGHRGYRVLLWYTHYDGPRVERRWVQLYKHEKK